MLIILSFPCFKAGYMVICYHKYHIGLMCSKRKIDTGTIICIGVINLNRKSVFLWLMTAVVAVYTIVRFVCCMYIFNTKNVLQTLMLITITIFLYKVGMKLVTYEKGYNAFQAIQFYWRCRKEGLVKLESCKKKTVKFREIAEQFEFARKMKIEDLFEMYENAHDILYRKREK